MANKGKAVMTGAKDSSDKTRGGMKKRKNRDVLQFFEDAAEEFDASDGSDWSDFFDDDDFLGEFNDDCKAKSGPEKFDQPPFFPKEEELSGDELEKVLKERYGSGSGFVRYAEADYESKGSVDRSFLIPSIVEPIIWKVKCKVGREKNVVFCLIQKYVDLKVLGTKLQIISSFAVEHVKGFVFVEAEKQSDVTEACYQLADVYSTLVTQVPSNEVGQLLNVRKKSNEVKEGTWARVKNGIYRSDLTQVVAVNNERKRATVKLIPRVDMQALMEKYGGGSKLKRPKKGVPPTARLISSRELEEFRPLIQYRRDRDTGKVFEFFDGLMLKDGFLFKKVSIDSLAFWDVNPTEDELQKFIPPCQDESDNVEWLSQLYGEKKKCDAKIISKGYEKGGKGGKGGKGEGSSGSSEQSGFEVHDLVLFGKRDFGMVIGMEKDEKYKVLKEGSEGPVTMTFGQKELKYLPIEKKFIASDHRMKTISINDAVRILDGPSKGKHGVVKQIYRGIIFVYDENDLENAYFCSKSKLSEKVKQSDSTCQGKDEGIPSSFEDVPSSPKSPLSPKKPWQMKDNSSDDRGDKGEIFSVGQSLRIKVGPLKGYLCRVLAVRYSEVIVKLDSKQKVLTVKHEHLSEVREKSSTSSMSQDPGLASSFKPFDLLGADGAADDWLKGASGSANGDGWNVAPSNERSTWAAVSSWGTSVQDGTTATALPDSVNDDTVKEDATWLTKVNNNQKSNTDTAWGKQSLASASTSWGKAKDSEGDNAAPWNISGSSSGQVSKETSSWDDKTTDKGNLGSWDNGNRVEDASGWKKLGSGDAGSSGWGTQKTCDVNPNMEKSTGDFNAEDSWGKAAGGFKSTSVENKGWGSSSQSPACDNKEWGDGGKGKGGDDSKGWGKGPGSWTNSQKGNSGAGWGDGGGPKVGDNSDEAKTDGWKAKSFGDDSASGFTKLGETGSWGQPKSFENDGGFNGGRGSGGRGGRGGDQFGRGRGRGRSFDGGRFSSSNEDGQDNHSSGNHGWNKSDGGSSWGNSSAGDGLKSSWGKGKSWNDDAGGDCKVDHPEKNSSDSAWNSAPSGSSSWDNKGKGVAAEGASWGKSSEARDEASAMDIDDNKTSSLPDNSWGKAENKSTKDIGGSGGWASTQVGQSAEGNAWSKGGGTYNSSSWGKGADGSVGGGNGSWQRSGNSESDQGFGSSRGRGRGFGRGRDFAGRGRGRSDGPGQGSSWRSEGQGGASWGNSSGGNGGTSWNNSEPSGNKSWGSSGGWNQKEQDDAPNEASKNKSWDSGSGGSSWGKSQSGGSGGGSWGKS